MVYEEIADNLSSAWSSLHRKFVLSCFVNKFSIEWNKDKRCFDWKHIVVEITDYFQEIFYYQKIANDKYKMGLVQIFKASGK